VRQDLEQAPLGVHEEGYREIQLLAQRLRVALGDLDDMAILAIAEATGAPEAYVRLVANAPEPTRRKTLFEQVRESFRAMTPEVRSTTFMAVLGTAAGLFTAVSTASSAASSFAGTVALIASLAGLAYASVAKTPAKAFLAGALLGGTAFTTASLFGFLFGMVPGAVSLQPHPALLVVFLALFGFVALVGNLLVKRYRGALGLKDPVEERQALLRQLQDLQARLRSDERAVTFLSVDIVGSTGIKGANDSLDVEFTFGEYHVYVESVVTRFQGKVHSTAGDGVTAAFDSPEQGYRAGRALLAGLFEFNSFRNKLRDPIDVRCGVHSGTVHAPGANIEHVNFAEVIDIAAHMQKLAEPGTLVVSEATAAGVPGGMRAIGDEIIDVHGVPAVLCRPARHQDLQLALAKPSV
jgi:class 3 adenylate cyclase